MTEDEHHLYIFEKIQAAIDTEITRFAQEQPGLHHDRVKRDVWHIMAAYLRSKRNASMTSEEQYWAGLLRFMGEAYPGNAPRGEYEAVYNIVERVKKCMGWEQIADPTISEGLQHGAADA